MITTAPLRRGFHFGRPMKLTLNASPPIMRLKQEADAMGVSFPSLLTADLVRCRALAEAALPPLDAWEREAIDHALSGIESHRILAGDDSLPSAGWIAAAVQEMADGRPDDEMLRLEALARQAREWSPIAILGLMMRLRQ